MLDRTRIAKKLAELELVYRTGRTPEELALLADIWATDFAGEDQATLERAIDMHRGTARYWPTLAEIRDLLPQCRRAPQQAAIPERVGPGQRIPPPHVAVARAEFIRDVAAGLYRNRRDEQEARARELGLLPPEDAESFMEACGW